jgi:dipeptidase
MCDTFAATTSATHDGSIILGKNSNREANEAQALEYHPAREYPAGARTKCTYIDIPPVAATQPVLLCRPFWMWGAEMGVNAAGLAIGNEAVWTRMPLNRKGGLTGMDLVRLALERARTAEAGIDVIVGLLHDFGQGGFCGYQDRRMIYHNSFMLADPRSAWVLETAGPYWAAKQVQGIYAISNGLTLGKDFDRGHPDLSDFGNGGKPLHFTRRFSNRLYTVCSASRARRSFVQSQLASSEGHIDVHHAMTVLQAHGAASYRPDSHWLGDRICAHATSGLTRKIAQTTGSLVAHLKPGRVAVWVTGTAAPCTAIFKPVWFDGEVLPDIGPAPAGHFNPSSLWWFHEQFHRRVLMDFETASAGFREGQKALQANLAALADTVSERRPTDVTAEAFRLSREWTARQIERLSSQGTSAKRPPRRSYRRYWDRQNRLAGLHL